MSTRSTTHFVEHGHTRAIVYRHSDGYPEGHGADLRQFFDAIEAQTADHRYDDPSYLAAKLVVWLADRFARRYDTATGEWIRSEPLDFLSVGVCLTDPGDIEYLYEIDCGVLGADGRPEVRCYETAGGWDKPISKGRKVPIREREQVTP